MQESQLSQTDQLIKVSRTMLWFSLLIVVILGATSLAFNFFPEVVGTDKLTRLLQVLPVIIIVGLFAIRKKGIKLNPQDQAMKAILDDELRVASMHRAYRYGFLCLLVAQPIFALALQMVQKNDVWIMCTLSLITGLSVFIVSLLFLDR